MNDLTDIQIVDPNFCLTFNFRATEGQSRQLHELPNIGRNRSWEAAGRQDEAGRGQRQKSKIKHAATEFRPITRLDM